MAVNSTQTTNRPPVVPEIYIIISHTDENQNQTNILQQNNDCEQDQTSKRRQGTGENEQPSSNIRHPLTSALRMETVSSSSNQCHEFSVLSEKQNNQSPVSTVNGFHCQNDVASGFSLSSQQTQSTENTAINYSCMNSIAKRFPLPLTIKVLKVLQIAFPAGMTLQVPSHQNQ